MITQTTEVECNEFEGCGRADVVFYPFSGHIFESHLPKFFENHIQ